MPNPTGTWFSVADAAKVIGVTPERLRQRINAGDFDDDGRVLDARAVPHPTAKRTRVGWLLFDTLVGELMREETAKGGAKRRGKRA